MSHTEKVQRRMLLQQKWIHIKTSRNQIRTKKKKAVPESLTKNNEGIGQLYQEKMRAQ
jgi:hypothetical protein